MFLTFSFVRLLNFGGLKMRNKKGNVAHYFEFNPFFVLISTPQTQDVNWMYIRRLEDVQDVFWTSYVSSIYVLCLRGRWTGWITSLDDIISPKWTINESETGWKFHISITFHGIDWSALSSFMKQVYCFVI